MDFVANKKDNYSINNGLLVNSSGKSVVPSFSF